MIATLLGVLCVLSSGALTGQGAFAANTNQRIAKAGVLTLDDFPSGWKASSSKPDSAADKIANETKSCQALDKARSTLRKRKAGHATSDDFKKSDETYSNTIGIVASDRAARSVFRVYASAKSQRCLADVAKARAEESAGASGSEVTVTARVSEVSGATVGDSSARYELEIEASTSQSTFSQKGYLELVYVLSGRSVAVYQHSATYEQSDNHFPDQLIDASQRRLSAALEGKAPTDPKQPAPLGSAQTAGDGAVVTVFSVQSGVPGKYADIQPGKTYTVVDAQICAPPGSASTVNANAYAFALVFADNTRAQPEFFGGPDPELQSGALTTGACTRGNISFSPAQQAAATQVVYEATAVDSKPLIWVAS